MTTVVIIGGDNGGKGGAQLGQNCEGKESKGINRKGTSDNYLTKEPIIIV